MNAYAEHMADHSQWGEQGIILGFFGDHVGTFLDLGAYDGVTGSNSRGLTDRYWSGACIEASPYNFTKLVENHRLNEKVVCVNAAVMPVPGLVRIQDTLGQIASCTDNPLINEWVQRRYWVSGITPDEIVNKLGDRWDFVSIDIEGVDLDVLKVSERLLAHTRLICFEDARPCRGLEEDYYASVCSTLASFGFTKLVGRTTTADRIANTLLARP